MSALEQIKTPELERLLEIRSEIQKTNKKLDEYRLKGEKSKADQHRKKLSILNDELENATEAMIDIEKGIYMGLGVDLEDPSTREQPIYLQFEKQNNHSINLGTTRVGKTRNMMMLHRHLVQKGMNVVCVDPKGSENQEILAWMMEHLAEAGREADILYISPVFPEMSLFLNPLEGLSNEEVASLVAMLTVSGADLNADAQFFSSVAYKTIMTVLFALEYLELASDPTGELVDMQRKRELINYYHLTSMRGQRVDSYDPINNILQPDIVDRLYGDDLHSLTDQLKNRIYDRTFVTFKELARYSNPTALVALRENVKSIPVPSEKSIGGERYRKIDSIRRQAMTLLDDILSQEPQFFQKISISLSTLLTQLSVGRMGQVFCSVRINPLLHRLHREDRGFVMLLQPAPLKFAKVSDMCVKILLRMFQSAMGSVGASGKKHSTRTAVMIDEAGAVMYPGIEELFNKAGGLGMSLYLYTQSFKDLYARLGDKLAEIVLDNINTYNIMRTNDNSSKESASVLLGNVRKKKIVLLSGTTSDAMRMNTQIQLEPAMEADHFMRLPPGRGVLIHDSKRFMVEYAHLADPKATLNMPELPEVAFRDEMARMQTEIESAISTAYKEFVSLDEEHKEQMAKAYRFNTESF